MSRFKHINLIIWILIDLAALGVALWLASSILHSNVRLAEKDNQVKIMAAREEELNTLERGAKETANDRALLSSYFVDSRDVTGFLDSLESLGQEIGVRLDVQSINNSSNLPPKQVNPPTTKQTNEPAKQANRPPTLKISFKGEGAFAGLFHLVKLLEQVPYELKINKVSFSLGTSSVAEEGSPDWTGSFEVELLSFISNPVK
ncbi:MAG: hypothetical protein UV08_C0032G0025 [Parcubacteria group bacterium GW2011_GWA2_42_18]|nr:MAG: hypothetical protein UV08_C0032G0025 [Parcubacteria group bacterium GW2011_GWA2_42_18]